MCLWSLFFLFLFIYIPQKTYQELSVKSKKDNIPLRKCIIRLITTLSILKTSIWYSPENEKLLSQVLKGINVPVVLNTTEHPKEKGLETRVPCELVVILCNLDIESIVKSTLWNRDTKFFVFAKEVEGLENIFKQFWKLKIINAFGVAQKNNNVVLVYSFLPFSKNDCGIGKIFIVDQYLEQTDSFNSNGKVFQDSVRIQNLNNCRVNITIVDVKPNVIFFDKYGLNATTHVEGIEGKVMNAVAKKLNFNATFLIALDGIGWGWINPSPHGAVGEVYTGRSDFAIGLLAPTIERFESLDVSLPYNGEECITYGVPTGAGASTPNWITILVFEFTSLTWVLILFSFVLVFVVFKVVNEFSRVKWFDKEVDLILFIFSSCLGLPVRSPDFLSFRFSLLIWITFSFIITVAYKSSMGSKLTVPNRDPDINTFQELLDSDLQLTGYNNMLRLLQYNDSEPVIKKMLARFKVTDFDIDDAVDRIAAERKIAYVRHTTTFLYYALINPKAKGHIHVIKDCIMLYYPMIVTKKNSPFSNRLNQLISRLIEGGITKMWRSEYIYKVPPPTKPFLKLSNDHMYGVFCILFFGYLIGFLVLLAELYKFYTVKKDNHKL